MHHLPHLDRIRNPKSAHHVCLDTIHKIGGCVAYMGVPRGGNQKQTKLELFGIAKNLSLVWEIYLLLGNLPSARAYKNKTKKYVARLESGFGERVKAGREAARYQQDDYLDLVMKDFFPRSNTASVGHGDVQPPPQGETAPEN